MQQSQPDRESQARAEGVGPWTGHAGIDRRVLEMTQIVVEKIDRNPALVRVGLENIARWTRQKGGYVPQCHAEWKGLIESHPWERLREILLKESDEGQRLRSSHPFTGILTQDERDAIYAQHGIDIPRIRREYEERTGRPWPTTPQDGDPAMGDCGPEARRRNRARSRHLLTRLRKRRMRERPGTDHEAQAHSETCSDDRRAAKRRGVNAEGEDDKRREASAHALGGDAPGVSHPYGGPRTDARGAPQGRVGALLPATGSGRTRRADARRSSGAGHRKTRRGTETEIREIEREQTMTGS